METGAPLGDLVVITKGLEPGERVAASGNFPIDSEIRLQLAAAAKDPVRGMDVDPSKAGHK